MFFFYCPGKLVQECRSPIGPVEEVHHLTADIFLLVSGTKDVVGDDGLMSLFSHFSSVFKANASEAFVVVSLVCGLKLNKTPAWTDKLSQVFQRLRSVYGIRPKNNVIQI